jgi:hypothetical protein
MPRRINENFSARISLVKEGVVTRKMLSEMFFYSVHDQIALLLGTVELLALTSPHGMTLKQCKKIKKHHLACMT